MENTNEIIDAVKEGGFDGAIAIATEAEVKAGAACGQMSIINETDDGSDENGC
jgi:hypothetical protein